MCTTIGYSYKNGQVFGRTLEVSVPLDNKILYVPKNSENFIQTWDGDFSTKYATLGTGFFDIHSFGDGINEEGLMGSSNFLPKYATFADEPVEGKINLTTSEAFDYLLSRCKNIEEVRTEAEDLILVKQGKSENDQAIQNHFFFMGKDGDKIVLESKDGRLLTYDNPYGVLTNAPEFPWHVINLKNYLNLNAENINTHYFNGEKVEKLGEGTGMMGLPGDFTPPSRFVRAAFFVSNTPKNLAREEAILQNFRILSQFDIPKGAVIDTEENHTDETLYTSVMDTQKGAYYLKQHGNINIQSFYLKDFEEETTIKMIEVEKEMSL